MRMSRWLTGWINPEDKERDGKLLAFLLVAGFGVWKLACNPITDQWVNAFYGLCALVGLGGSAWAAVDKWKSKETPCSPSPNPGSSVPDVAANASATPEPWSPQGGK
jgi:hypothetical protein